MAGYVLTSFPYTRPWGERLTQFMLAIARELGGAMLGSLVAVMIFVIARLVTGGPRVFFARVVAGRISVAWLHRDTA